MQQPPRLVGIIFVGLCLCSIVGGILYGALVPSPDDLVGGTTFLVIAAIFLICAGISMFVWRRAVHRRSR